MAQSFQKEKPPARINLFLEVLKDGAQKKVELPLRMLMVGDYKGREDDTPLEDREVTNLNAENFDDVMRSMDLGLDYAVPDRLRGGDEEIKVSLTFEDMKSFHPEQVAKQVPALRRMLAMRNLLQDLRNRVVSMGQFRKQLEAIVKDKEAFEKLTSELDQLVTREDVPSDGDASSTEETGAEA